MVRLATLHLPSYTTLILWTMPTFNGSSNRYTPEKKPVLFLPVYS
jgi:hypothetical protein